MPTSRQSLLDLETDHIAAEAGAALKAHLVKAGELEPDPVRFAEGLGIRLWEGQEQLLRGVREHRRVICVAGNAVGKTFTSALLVAWWMQWPDAVVLTTASTWTQVKNQLWREINALHRQHGLDGACNQTTWELGARRYALGISTNEPDRFQGFHGARMLVLIDEASGVRQDIWTAAESVATGPLDRLVTLGNPVRPTGPFYDGYRHRQGLIVHLSVPECLAWQREHGRISGLVSEEWLEDRRAAWGQDSDHWRVHVLGQFPTHADTYLFPPTLLDEVMESASLPDGPADQVGVDVARFGGDRTVAYARYGNRLVEVFCLEGTDHVATRRRLQEFHQERGASVYAIDASGEGSGLADELHAKGLPVIRVAFGGSAHDQTRYADRKSEGYFRLRQFLEDGGHLPRDEELAEELGVVEATIVENRERVAYRIVPKERLRKALRRSPDKADAAMLAVLPMPDYASRSKVWKLVQEAANPRQDPFDWPGEPGFSILDMEF